MIPPDFVNSLSDVLIEMEDESVYGLRGWKEHCGSPSQHEPAITLEINRRLSTRGLNSGPRQYAHSSQVCDIVTDLDDGTEVWIEAKIYYTIWFRNKEYAKPQLAKGSETYSGKIRSLIDDCSMKLLPVHTSERHVAGLLLGFEMQNTPAISHLRNPSSKEIDTFLKSEIANQIPQWSIHELSGPQGWSRTRAECPQIQLCHPGDSLTAVVT